MILPVFSSLDAGLDRNSNGCIDFAGTCENSWDAVGKSVEAVSLFLQEAERMREGGVAWKKCS